MAIRMPMMSTTTMSSMSVNPASWSPRRCAGYVDILGVPPLPSDDGRSVLKDLSARIRLAP